MRPVRGEALRVGEGHDGDRGVPEAVEVIAHGDHVLLARQSSQVPVQDQHQRPAGVCRDAPRLQVLVDQVDVGNPGRRLARSRLASCGGATQARVPLSSVLVAHGCSLPLVDLVGPFT